MPRRLSNFKVIWTFKHPILQVWNLQNLTIRHLVGYWNRAWSPTDTTIEELETQPLNPELFPQSCMRLLDAASRVLIRHVVCCGNTITEPYLVKSFVSKGSETDYLNITNHIFEAELHVDCSKAIWNTINAIPVLLQTSFTVCRNTTVCSRKRQSQYRMESFVLKGFETRHLNITNHVSFETELPLDCSEVN